MAKVTEEDIKEVVLEVGKMEKEHRRGSTFYASISHVITQEDVDFISEEWERDATDFLGIQVVLSGIYDDNYGFDDLDIEYYKVEEYQELVPEKVIPAHYVNKAKTEPFVPEWE